jgi:hypothetical protein
MTARGRGLARLIGKPGMLVWLARHPDMVPVWLDGQQAGAETAAHRDAVWDAELAAAFEEGFRAGLLAERVSLEQDWSGVRGVLTAHAKVAPHAVLVVKRGLSSGQQQAS